MITNVTRSAIGLTINCNRTGAKNQMIVADENKPNNRTGIAINKLNNKIGKLISAIRINDPIIATGNTNNRTGRTDTNNIIPGIVANANGTNRCTKIAKKLSVISAVPQRPINIQAISTMI